MVEAIRAEITIQRDPMRVYHALTDADQLMSWFCEHAEVDLNADRYEFWGRHTPDSLERDPDRIQIIDASPGEQLIYRWRHFGADSLVSIEIARFGDGTIVSVQHGPLGDVVAWLPEMFWSMALDNLRGYLERGDPGLRYDYTARRQGDVRHEVDIDAPADAVFEALIDPYQLERYMARGKPHIEPQVGGRYDLNWGDEGPLKIVDIDPPRKLAYSWTEKDTGATGTVVTWELDGSGGKTHLTLVHSGFASDREGTDFTLGWLEFLNRIRHMVETGPSWTRPDVEIFEADATLFSLPSAGIWANVDKPRREDPTPAGQRAAGNDA